MRTRIRESKRRRRDRQRIGGTLVVAAFPWRRRVRWGELMMMMGPCCQLECPRGRCWCARGDRNLASRAPGSRRGADVHAAGVSPPLHPEVNLIVTLLSHLSTQRAFASLPSFITTIPPPSPKVQAIRRIREWAWCTRQFTIRGYVPSVRLARARRLATILLV